MLKKSSAIDRLLRENPRLEERRFGLPFIGLRTDNEQFNPTVQSIADAIDFYGFEVRDKHITTIKDTDLGNGNPMNYKPFPLAIQAMKKSLDSNNMYSYPYTEGDDNIRKVLLDYIEQEGFINTNPYSYDDVDEKGLSVHNLTFLPSTSITFNIIINIISKPGDVVLIPGPNYGLFTIRAERAGAEVEIINLEKEDNFLINPQKLAKKIDEINESLQMVYNRRKGYVPRVVAFLNTNPNNPTGKVMGEKEADLLKELGEVCQKRGVFIIDDLVYRDITYDKNNLAKPIATIPGMFRNTISLLGLSKSYGMASLRAGFVVADEIIIREVVNRIFQEMDSSPDIVGHALAGAFNNTKERNLLYDEYFTELRATYFYKYQLLKALVKGIDSIESQEIKEKIKKEVKTVLQDDQTNEVLTGLPYVDFPENLEPESGFFAILDFSKIKGMKYHGKVINTERDLLKFFYKTSRIRFLVGQSICWPYKDELVGRVTFALLNETIIHAFYQMHKALECLKEKEDYIIRKNELKDQEQIIKIKLDRQQEIHMQPLNFKCVQTPNYKEQTENHINGYEDFKDLVLVAARNEEILGYSYYEIKDHENKYDAELVGLYVKSSEMNRGIGTALFKETVKELLAQKKKNMITWCLKENESNDNKITSTVFYENLGGKQVESKEIKIGDRIYQSYGYYFDLEAVENKEGI